MHSSPLNSPSSFESALNASSKYILGVTNDISTDLGTSVTYSVRRSAFSCGVSHCLDSSLTVSNFLFLEFNSGKGIVTYHHLQKFLV